MAYLIREGSRTIARHNSLATAKRVAMELGECGKLVSVVGSVIPYVYYTTHAPQPPPPPTTEDIPPPTPTITETPARQAIIDKIAELESLPTTDNATRTTVQMAIKGLRDRLKRTT